jgi:hypothetical protein
MPDEKEKNSSQNGFVAITVALLGFLGVLVANWNNLFPKTLGPSPDPTATISPVISTPSSQSITPSPINTSSPIFEPQPSKSPEPQPSKPPEPQLSKSPEPQPSKSPQNFPQSEITIDQPTADAIVDRSLVATGTLQNLANGDSFWAYVYPSVEKRYYPSKVSYDSDKKTWKVSLIVGSVDAQESGVPFEIGLLTANPQASEDLSKWGKNGTSKLPEGVVVLKSLSVKRR